MAIIISFLRAAMDMALNFCCPCLTTRDDPSPPISTRLSELMKAAKVATDGKEWADADLDGLIDYMSGLLETVREKSPLKKLAEEKLKSSKKTSPRPTSADLLNYKEYLTAATDAASAMEESLSANAVAVTVLQTIGSAGSLATAGLLVCANVLERFENVSEIQEECLDLFEKMYSLAKHVRELQRFPRLKEELKDPLKKATELILEASILCCFLIDSSKFARFFSTSDNKANLDRFRDELKAMYIDLDNGKSIADRRVLEDIESTLHNVVNSQKRRKAVPIEYPQGTVGMDEPLRKVIQLLDWESEKNALAVVVHGFGGLGKTTLADAVYATLFDTTEGCQYCMVKLFDTIESTPNVIDLQTQLIKDLRGTTEEAEAMPEIKTFEEGQREISRLLDQQVAFIYIDNVLLPDKVGQHRDALEQLLPRNMRKARKLRLLLTARDTTATDSISSVKRQFYPIETLPETESKTLIKKVLDDNETQLNPSQMDQIVSICGGVPKLLTVVAGFIGCQESAEEAFVTVMEERENSWKGKLGDDIECYVFACNKLEKDLREAFLDICSFFQGWDWEELSNIVGKPALHSLQRRTLVTKDVKSMTATVHDVIVTIGLRETKKERFRFSSTSEIREFLDQENEALENIKGIWSSDNSDHALKISATKLDLMAASLRVLKLGRVTVVEDKCQKKFKELIFFSAGISHLPFDVSMSEELRHLCYSPEDLQNLTQMPSRLRHIDLQLKSPSFHISSKCIKQLSKLRVLRLKNAELKTLPPNLGDLGDGLQELTLLNCKFLEELPESLSTLGSLRVLRMDSCSRLTRLPEDFGKLTSLQELHFSECKSLKALPTSLGKLTSLQELRLAGCESLKALPGSLGKLTSLQELHLARCQNLAALPGSVEELSSLRLLDLSECPIEDLPDGLGKLTSLVNLLLYHCWRLQSIPESIWRLTSLDSINLSWTNLKELPDWFCDLSSITKLAMDGCWGLERLPDRFGAITSLRRLSLNRCYRLKKLPESFSQLKYLEYLNLSWCYNLEELCEDFKGLSSLQVLLLSICEKLKKLPQDFNGLPSLDTLDLRYCDMLEGKSMEGIVKLKKLQTVLIRGSQLLLEEWGEIQKQPDQSWSFAVETGEGSLQGKAHFNLTNGQGKAFNISDLPLNTDLLVLFDCQQEFRHCSTLTIIEENMDDNLEMIYFGNHFSQLPHKVAGGIRGHASAKLFGQLFPILAYEQEEKFELSAIRAEIVPGEKGEKTLSCGEILSEESVEEFVVEKCGRSLKFKQLVKTAGDRDSNIELLRELFANGEEKTSYGFLKNGTAAKVGAEELKGKRILLDMRPANLCYDIQLQSLVDLYNVAEKERYDFEIITILLMQENTRRYVSNSFSREVPWLVLQNPWDLPNATKYFLLRFKHADINYPCRMEIIESNGTIAADNSLGILRMVNTWGTEAFPFTEKKVRELIDKEVKQMKEMSNLMFLFQHLQGISEQVEKAMRQQKMFWLCIGDCTTLMKSMLVEWNDNIYTIYIPNFYAPEEGERETVYFTHVRSGFYWPLKHPTAVTQVEMEGMCSLSLSEHEAIRFWARLQYLSLDGIFDDMGKLPDFTWFKKIYRNEPSSIIIMDEDGNLLTMEGKEIIELSCEEHSHDKAKGLVIFIVFFIFIVIWLR